MQSTAAQRRISPLTGSALFLLLCGLALAFRDIQWQLVSMASFHAGIVLTALALCFHAIRRQQAWRTELAVLATLAMLLVLDPALPAPCQDVMEYLMP
ncbi:MAG: hypothetical protein MI745_01110 [Pseudomonadales bacterium]|nr:hypothetical protein [Pseudomonadales bacterium]